MNQSNKLQKWVGWWIGGREDDAVREALTGGTDDVLRLAVIASRLHGSDGVESLRERVKAISGKKKT